MTVARSRSSDDAPGSAVGPAEPGARANRDRQLLRVAAALAIAGGAVARGWPRSALWLDEAQSVAFARLDLTAIPHALRTDGAPPLYYLLLHVWMSLFGDSDYAVRSLSVLAALATLPVFWWAVRRLADRRTALLAVVLLAINPFAIRYATEARMYALVVLEVAVGAVLLPAALQRPSARRLAGLTVLTAALLYTHYWALYLLGAVGVVLLAGLVRHRADAARRTWVRVVAAVVCGGVLWLPWVPSFRYQATHTATPWAHPPGPLEVFDIPLVHAGGHTRLAWVTLAIFAVAIIAAVLRPMGGDRSTRYLLGRQHYVVAAATIVAIGSCLAVAGAMQSGSALAGRYTSVLLPPMLLLVATGLARVRRLRVAVAAIIVMAGLSSALVVREIRSVRTPGRAIATVLAEQAAPNDVVVFCPDQLGPATARELARRDAPPLQLGTFPRWTDPARVDWVDYTEKYKEAAPIAFGNAANQRAGSGTVWLVWSDSYPPTQQACSTLRRTLSSLRPRGEELIEDRPDLNLDHGSLIRYPAAPIR